MTHVVHRVEVLSKRCVETDDRVPRFLDFARRDLRGRGGEVRESFERKKEAKKDARTTTQSISNGGGGGGGGCVVGREEGENEVVRKVRSTIVGGRDQLAAARLSSSGPAPCGESGAAK